MSCTDTTTCYPCEQTNVCAEGCPFEVDAGCVIYTGDPLSVIDVNAGDYLDDILLKLNNITFSQTVFSANSTNSILATAGGTMGHSPLYAVRLDPTNNLITVSATGLKVDSTIVLSGKVKVNASDTLDYLENQFSPATDTNNVIAITPTTIGGIIYLVPSINKTNLINWLKDDLCDILDDCIPAPMSTTTTTSTSTTSTSTTSTSSTTTTTTQAPNDFIIHNLSGQGIFTVTLRDEVSLINYIVDNTTDNNQLTSLSYTGTTNESEVVITHGGNVPVGISVSVNNVVVYNNLLYVGGVTIQNLAAQSNISVLLYPWAGTTSTSTSTTSTSSTTTLGNCVTYSLTNTTGSIKTVNFVNCAGSPASTAVNPSTTIEICAIENTVDAPVGVSVTLINSVCSTTTTTTSTTTTTLGVYQFCLGFDGIDCELACDDTANCTTTTTTTTTSTTTSTTTTTTSTTSSTTTTTGA